MRSGLLGACALIGLTLFSACSESAVGPEAGNQVSESELTFLRFAENAPPLATSVVSFWAVRGDDREVEIEFAPLRSGEKGEEFLEFEVPGDALLRYPDGRSFARGDSVRITIRVIDPTRFLFEFEPAGLQFDPRNPAQLEVSYDYADRDYDDDGDEDDNDFEVERTFGMWHQEQAGALWTRLGTIRVEDLEEVRADITGFSRYALASN